MAGPAHRPQPVVAQPVQLLADGLATALAILLPGRVAAVLRSYPSTRAYESPPADV